jgi:4-hydroxybenzoate polyprenyltransferase
MYKVIILAVLFYLLSKLIVVTVLPWTVSLALIVFFIFLIYDIIDKNRGPKK